MAKFNFNNPFISMRHKNFRIYWFGMNVSLIGSWMQIIAQPWLALSITNDAFLVSLVVVAQFISPFFLSLFSGALVDKFDKKKMLIIAQTGMMFVAFGFALMVFMKFESYEGILILAFTNGIFNSIDSPCRQSMVYDLVEGTKDLLNAIALNSMSFNVSRILGPSLAGIVMAYFGVGYCFLFNALSFLVIILSLFYIKLDYQTNVSHDPQNIIFAIKDGLLYVKNNEILYKNIIVMLIMAMFILKYNVTVSAFVKFTLGGDEKAFGYLMSFLGAGSFLGAFFVAVTSKNGVNFKVITIMPFIAGFSLMTIGLLTNFWFVGIMLAVTGFAFVVTSSSINSLIQLNTQNHYRGRVMSIYNLVFQGSAPFGAVFAGYLTKQFGPQIGFIVCGATVVLLLSVFLLKNRN